MNKIKNFLNEYFDKNNKKHLFFIIFFIIIVVAIICLLFFYGKFNINSVPNTLLYSLVAFIFCVFSVIYLYAKKGGSNRFAYFIISFFLTVSAVMLFSILFNLNDDPIEKSKVEAYFFDLKLPGNELLQIFLFYAKDIFSLVFAALGVSSMAAAIREGHEPMLNKGKADIASVDPKISIGTLEINDISKDQYFDISKENNNNYVSDSFLFAIVIINIYLIVKKDK